MLLMYVFEVFFLKYCFCAVYVDDYVDNERDLFLVEIDAMNFVLTLSDLI